MPPRLYKGKYFSEIALHLYAMILVRRACTILFLAPPQYN
ncbi:hypothetical protein NUACC26_080060 [Scytonema sp. NUACC26]